MAALKFAITDEGIFLATDTLVTHDGRPSMFTAKVLTLPHLHGLICGFGSMALFQRWSLRVLGSILTTNMSHLDLFAPNSLREIWAQMSDEDRGDGNADIYHLCYDPDADQFGGFGYQSSSDFESEPLDDGVYSMPAALNGKFSINAFPGDFVKAFRRVWFGQEALGADKRLHIGGEVIAYMMQRHEIEGQPRSTLITAQTAFRFENFEKMFLDCGD